MTVKDCIQMLMEDQKMTQKTLAEQIGVKLPSNISVTLSRNDGMGMRVETLIRWLDALDADLVIQPREGDLEDEMLLDGEGLPC